MSRIRLLRRRIVAGVLDVRTRLHRDDRVLGFLLVGFGIAEIERTLLDSEFDGVAYRQKERMLRVFRANVVDDFIGLKDVVLAENLLRGFLLVVRAKNFTGDALAAVLGGAAGLGIHGEQHAAVIRRQVVCQEGWTDGKERRAS